MRQLKEKQKLAFGRAMKLIVKNMVCQRCIKVVQDELEQLGYSVDDIKLGEVTIAETPDAFALAEVKSALEASGFELLDDRQNIVVEKIKTLVIEVIHHGREKPLHENFSDFIARNLNMPYPSISKIFSSLEGITLEQYIIHQKIERAKELLAYDEKTLSEISFELGYSSVQHLSSQFKKVTGLTPSHFKKIGSDRRKYLDEV